MILLAFFLPLAFYVLVLGIINRRPHPLMVSGTWDFVGILFAASGFLIFGGPFVLSTLNESWRTFLLLGPNADSPSGDRLWAAALALSILYFTIVVAGAAFLLWRQRWQTVVYNIDLASFEDALAAACSRLGLHPAHSGTSYLFDPAKDLMTAPAKAAEGIVEAFPPRLILPPDAREMLLLDVDHFRVMRHVTLRWSAAHSPLRQAIEAELALQLSDTLVPPSDVGAWLTVLAFALLGLSFLVGAVWMFYRFLNRI